MECSADDIGMSLTSSTWGRLTDSLIVSGMLSHVAAPLDMGSIAQKGKPQRHRGRRARITARFAPPRATTLLRVLCVSVVKLPSFRPPLPAGHGVHPRFFVA